MGRPTENDIAEFESFSDREKAAVLYQYFVLGYNMEQVAENVFNSKEDEQKSRSVSCITRCYGFHGQNSGTYKKFAEFIEENDFYEFVRTHRDIPYDDRTILDEYLKHLFEKRKKQQEGRGEETQKCSGNEPIEPYNCQVENVNKKEQTKTVQYIVCGTIVLLIVIKILFEITSKLIPIVLTIGFVISLLYAALLTVRKVLKKQKKASVKQKKINILIGCYILGVVLLGNILGVIDNSESLATSVIYIIASIVLFTS